jgi:hypothetical protein
VTAARVEIDAGKKFPHAAVVDEAGRVMWSMRVRNDQTAIGALIERGCAAADAGRERPPDAACRRANGTCSAFEHTSITSNNVHR